MSTLTTLCYCKQEAHVPVWVLKINRGNLPGLLVKAYRGKIFYILDFVFLQTETLQIAYLAKRGHHPEGCIENFQKGQKSLFISHWKI